VRDGGRGAYLQPVVRPRPVPDDHRDRSRVLGDGIPVGGGPLAGRLWPRVVARPQVGVRVGRTGHRHGHAGRTAAAVPRAGVARAVKPKRRSTPARACSSGRHVEMRARHFGPSAQYRRRRLKTPDVSKLTIFSRRVTLAFVYR